MRRKHHPDSKIPLKPAVCPRAAFMHAAIRRERAPCRCVSPHAARAAGSCSIALELKFTFWKFFNKINGFMGLTQCLKIVKHFRCKCLPIVYIDAGDFMTFRYDIDKAIAATAYLLQRARGSYNVLPLVKALYYANRKSLVDCGRSITGDSLCSMENGTVVSNTYDLMKGSAVANPNDLKKWREFISEKKGNTLTLIRLPDFGILSGREIKQLDEAYQVVSTVRGTWKAWAHRVFPEYENVGKGSKPIDPKTILRLEKIAEDEISEIEEEIAEVNWLKSIAV
jgi:hypothetical protein